MNFGWRVVGSAVLVLAILTDDRGSGAADLASTPQAGESGRRELDAAAPLASRVRDAAPAVYQALKHFRPAAVVPVGADRPSPAPGAARKSVALRGPEPTPHALTDRERQQLQEAIDILPARHWRVLTRRVRAINVLDAMPVGGMVLPVDSSGPEFLFDIVINATVFRETASAWLTAKERSVFKGENSPLSVAIDVGPDLDAIAYVLLHEATHVVDLCEQITAASRPAASPLGQLGLSLGVPGAPSHPFLVGTWTNQHRPEPRYLDPRRGRIEFYAPTGSIPAHEMLAAYWSLAETPFVSLYGARNAMEDLAEYATVYHLTEVLNRPYRVVVAVKGVKVFEYEPMKSPLVRGRIKAMQPFYK